MTQSTTDSGRPVAVPGPDHPITVTPTGGRVTATIDGHVVADSTGALTLQEADYPAVQYIPREDADLSQLEPTDHASYCPYKGDASYFSIPSAGERGVNAVWTYEVPHEAVSEIAGRLAFYADRVDVTT